MCESFLLTLVRVQLFTTDLPSSLEITRCTHIKKTQHSLVKKHKLKQHEISQLSQITKKEKQNHIAGKDKQNISHVSIENKTS